MFETKNWWQSRTIWVQIVAMGFALLAGTRVLPEGVTQEEVVTGVMGAVALVNVFLRFTTKKVIE